MKKTRKFAAMVAAMALAATMVVPSMAFADNVNIKVQTNGTEANELTHVTPDADKAVHTYTAYQIFTGVYTLKPGITTATSADDYEFKVTGLGSDAKTANLLTNAKFLAFKASDDKSTVYEAIAALGDDDVTEAQKAIAAAQALDGIGDGSDKATELANILAEAITSGGTNLTTTDAPFAEGYYLVKDTYSPGTDGANDAVSKFILRVNSKKDTDGITIIPKKSYPSVIKKVKEDDKTALAYTTTPVEGSLDSKVNVSEGWNDVADYSIGQGVPFKLYGSMPATLNDYKAYYYEFSDKLGKEFDQPESVTVNVGSTSLVFKKNNAGKYELASGYLTQRAEVAEKTETNTVYTFNGDPTFMNQVGEAFADDTDYADADDKAKYVYDHWDTFCAAVDEGTAYKAEDLATYVIKKDDVVITPAVPARTEDKTTDGNCRVTWTDAIENEAAGTLSVTFENVKGYAGVTKDTVVTVEYDAVLNENAKIGLPGQENAVKLIYSNNPNVDYRPDTDDNTDDGAGHKTGNTDNTPEDKVVVFTYEIDINKIDDSTNQNLPGAKFQIKQSGTVIKMVDNEDGTYTVAKPADMADGSTKIIVTEVVSDSNGLFKIIGLDSGTYTLTETLAPDGYTTPVGDAADFEVVLTAETLHTQEWNGTASTVLTDISGTINGEEMDVLEADDTLNRGVDGGVAGQIANNKGTALPSTGGMGTTLFVLGGGVTAALAGVYLISKKRAENAE